MTVPGSIPVHPAVRIRRHRDGRRRQLLYRRRLRGYLASGRRHRILLAVYIGQSSDFEGLRNPEQRSDLFLRNVDLALVHKLDGRLELGPLDIPHNHDRMLAGILEKQRLEVRATSGQDHLVAFHRVSIASQGDIDERLTLQKLIEHVRQIRLVIVPSQAELLRRSRSVLHVVVVRLLRYLKVQQHVCLHNNHNKHRYSL